jgi:hypothetical protein
MRSFRLTPAPALATLASLALVPLTLGACSNGGGGSGNPTQRVTGQSDYASAPLPGSGAGSHSGGAQNAGASSSGGGAPTAGTG